MSREFDIPKSHVIVAGTEYRLLGSTFAAGGQASLYEAVAKNSDVSRRFLIKRFHDSGDYSEEFESEELSQKVAANVHQAILAAAFYDKNQRTSVMLKASSDCFTVQDILIAWEDDPPEDPASDYFDIGRFLESIQIVKSLLGALSGIHKNGVLHMDISPSNVMWGKTEAHGTTYLLDFSCCTKIGSTVGERQRTTLSFSAPEAQIPGTVLTPAADIYSVGAVFLLLVAGMAAASNNRSEKKWSIRRLPGEGNTNVTDRVDDLDIPDAYKGKLSGIIIKATTSVEKRYQSASEMLADIVELEKIIAGRGMTPETLIRGSAELFRKECNAENGIFHYKLQDDLITEAVDFDSKAPIDILTQNTILLGSGGSGKTTKVRKLWEQCLSDWKKDRKNNSIPVFVPLNTFDSKKSNWDFFIRDYITEVYFPDLSENVKDRRADLFGLFNSTEIVLFLDGINEAVDSSMLNAEIATLAAFKNVTVIITSRNDLGDGWSKTKELFSMAEMRPLNDDLIVKKLHEKGLGSPSERLLETLRRPMFLALYLQIKITDKAVETPGQILYAHHRHLIDAYKTGCHEEAITLLYEWELNNILPGVASAIDRMRFTTSNVIKAVQKIPIGEEHDFKLRIWGREQYLKYAPNVTGQIPEEDLISAGKGSLAEKLIATMQSCGIVRATTNKQEYTFCHQNYLEFYQAYDVYLQMNTHKKGQALPQCLCENVLSVPVARYLGEIWGEASFETKVDCSEDASPIEKWMQANLAGKRGAQAQLAVKNCIEIMKWTRNCYITANYSDLDLSLATFYNCFLPNSVFTRSIINDHIFLNFGHKYSVENVAILTTKNWLITTSRQEMFFWDLSSGAFIDKVSCEGLITHITVSENEELVAVGLCEDGPLPVQIFRTQDRSLATKITFWEEALCPEDVLYDDLSACRLEHTSTMLCFASDNRTLLCEIGEYGIECIDVLGNKQPRHPYEINEYHPRELITCALSPDRLMVACASSSVSIDDYSDDHKGVISLWTAETGEFIRDISLGEIYLKNIASNSAGQSSPSVIIRETAVVGTPSGGLLLHSDTEHREVRNAHNTAITQIYAVANGDYFFTQAADRSFKIWNIHSLQSWTSSPVSKGGFTGVITQSKRKIPWRDTGDLKVYQFELPEAFLYWYEHVESIFYDAAVSEDGKRIAVTDGDDIWIYNTEEGIEQLHIKELPDGLSSINLSSDGSTLTATFHDLTVKIFNTYNGAETSWDVISAEDISNCVFRNVETEAWIRTILQLNGAIFSD